MYHSILDLSHMDIHVGENLSTKENNVHLQLQIKNDSFIMEDFIVASLLV